MNIVFRKDETFPSLLIGEVGIVPNHYASGDGVEVIHPNNLDSKIARTWEELVEIVNEFSR